MSQRHSAENLGTWKVLLQLAQPYKRRFLLIALLALLGVGADLLQPLIYRTAINDVAGLFVDRVAEKAGPPVAPTEAQTDHMRERQLERLGEKAGPPVPPTEGQSDHIRDRQLERLEKTQLPHRPDYVAPRPRQQAV